MFDTLNVSGEHPIPSPSSKKSSPGNQNISKGSNASTRKEEIDQHGYAVPKDNVVNRPWVDILAENRAKWQKKHDAGEKCIEFDQMDRPTCASTMAT